MKENRKRPAGRTEDVPVYIGIGSNINPYPNIERALRMLGEAVRVTAVSPFYRSRAVGGEGQPDFVNGVIAVDAMVPPRALKYGVLRKIEDELGRTRGEDKNAARTIDLDLLLYGELVINTAGIVVPDPGLRRYAFVAVPLLDLAPEIRLPDTGEKLKDVFSGNLETYRLELLAGFSPGIGREIR
jgi:2-amino-4-hydroxy-6-hydroxymethyldihydropteridine diphosphokinase